MIRREVAVKQGVILGVLFFSSLLISQISLADDDPTLNMVAQNPLASASESAAPQATVKVRFINHGLKISVQDLQPMIQAAQSSFSQCGVNFKIEVTAVSAQATNLQDNLEEIDSQNHYVLSSKFFDFFTPWMASRSPGVIDIHLVDHLDSRNRDAEKHHKPLFMAYEGKTFASINIEHLYNDSRPENQRNPSLQSLAGDTSLLAIQTARMEDAKLTMIVEPQNRSHVLKAWREYSTYLMAHEMGHILLETQTAEQSYVDHLCPALGETCPMTHLMSAGGYDEKRFLNPSNKKDVIGFSPLPQIDQAQCARLKTHPLVQITAH
jgi:hypothetical protein